MHGRLTANSHSHRSRLAFLSIGLVILVTLTSGIGVQGNPIGRLDLTAIGPHVLDAGLRVALNHLGDSLRDALDPRRR